MTSHGYDPRQSPGLRYKRIVSCKDSFHSTDGVRTSTQTSSGAKGRTASIHGPRRRGQPEHSHPGRRPRRPSSGGMPHLDEYSARHGHRHDPVRNVDALADLEIARDAADGVGRMETEALVAHEPVDHRADSLLG